MAGTFAHMTLVDTICRDAKILDGIDTLTPAMKQALRLYGNFCELGAVSPDMPYLKRLSADATRWGNVMHYWRTAEVARRAIPFIHAMHFGCKRTQKCMAWLFGYVAHLVTDLTLHPVLALRVGPYEQNPRQHRICELHQDVYIFHALGFGDITTAEYIKHRGIRSCADPEHPDRLDADVRRLWIHCLNEGTRKRIDMKNGLKAPRHPTDPDEWFEHYVRMIDVFAEEGTRFPHLCRNIAEAAGVIYPEVSTIDTSFIRDLERPEKDGSVQYDQLFMQTQAHVITTWRDLGAALDSGDETCLRLPDGDLDTGCDEQGRLIFW